jgi:prolyl 4-hydroxylase
MKMMQKSAFFSLPETWQNWAKENLARSCDPRGMLDIMVHKGGFVLRRAQDALIEASDGACAHLFHGSTPLAGIPYIDTSHNTIQTPDRLVHVLLSISAPRIVLLGNVLSEDECDGLIDLCEPRLRESMVVNHHEGGSYQHPSRTSQSAFTQRGETSLVARVETRLAFLSNWPVERSEGLQVLRYDESHEYKPHFDWFNPERPGSKMHMGRSGQRLGTFVLYLNDVGSGGATSFPKIGLEVMPRKGSALFFANTSAQRIPDQQSLHAGMPVIKGIKYVANKWLREGVL